MRLIWKLAVIGMLCLAVLGCQSDQTSLPIGPTQVVTTSTVRAIEPVPSKTPRKVVTLAPSTTPIATPTQQDQPALLLSEGFSDEQTCMETFDNTDARAEVALGEYAIDVFSTDEIVNANCETLLFGDFVLDVDATVTSVDADGSYYFGLIFRVAGDERYAFVLGNEGGYCAYYAKDRYVVPFTNSTDFPVQCWTLIPEVARMDGRQHLRVVAVKDRIDLYLNGELLAVFRDGKLHEGWVGFVVATAGGGNVQVMFDNLKVSRP